jgi:hypothetical protein
MRSSLQDAWRVHRDVRIAVKGLTQFPSEKLKE